MASSLLKNKRTFFAYISKGLSFLKPRSALKGSSAAIAAVLVIAVATVMTVGYEAPETQMGLAQEVSSVPLSCECARLAETRFSVSDSLTAGVALALFIDRDYVSLKEWDQMVNGVNCPSHAYFLYYKTAERSTNVLGVTNNGDIYQSNLKCHEGVLS